LSDHREAPERAIEREEWVRPKVDLGSIKYDVVEGKGKANSIAR